MTEPGKSVGFRGVCGCGGSVRCLSCQPPVDASSKGSGGEHLGLKGELDVAPAVMPGQERELARLMELLESQRVERWHATYNAAVTGIITRAAEYGWGAVECEKERNRPRKRHARSAGARGQEVEH